MSSPLALRPTAIATDPVCAMYRYIIPMRALIARGWSSGNIFVGITPQTQIAAGSPLLLARHIELPAAFYETAAKSGCRIVQDLDDYLWAIPADNPNAKGFTPELRAGLERALARAQAITVATEPLAEELRARGFPATVLPNLLDPADWHAARTRRPGTRLRVGWYGQTGVHASDLALLETVVRALINEVEFVFFGDCPAGLQDIFAGIEFHHSVNIALFPRMLAALDLDLMLAPLARNRFNECKSNLRLLQAGMVGCAVLATDIAPHRTLPVTLLENVPGDWIAAIRERASDREALAVEANQLGARVRDAYLVHDHAEAIYAAWVGRTPPARDAR